MSDEQRLVYLKENIMYYFYNHINSEKGNDWRNAYEVKAAALKHERRRLHINEEFSPAKPQVIGKGKRQSGWSTLFKAPLLLLLSLIK
jgi:hypothetical protein